ncbi:MAG: hypothetical protein ABGW69_01690 [Nanoarchaeota archaeon]
MDNTGNPLKLYSVGTLTALYPYNLLQLNSTHYILIGSDKYNHPFIAVFDYNLNNFKTYYIPIKGAFYFIKKINLNGTDYYLLSGVRYDSTTGKSYSLIILVDKNFDIINEKELSYYNYANKEGFILYFPLDHDLNNTYFFGFYKSSFSIIKFKNQFLLENNTNYIFYKNNIYSISPVNYSLVENDPHITISKESLYVYNINLIDKYTTSLSLINATPSFNIFDYIIKS